MRRARSRGVEAVVPCEEMGMSSRGAPRCLAHVPGLMVVMPSSPYDAKGILKTCIRDHNPIIVLEHKLLNATKGEVPEEEYLLPRGKPIVKREGADVTVIATSRMVLETLATGEALEQEGISCEVIDPVSIRPLDTESFVKSLQKTGRCIIVHEACTFGGIGALECPIAYNRELEQHVPTSSGRIKENIRKMS